MAAAVDTAYLASYCSIPESSIQTLVSEPTPDLLTTFLQTLVIRAQEHEALKSEHLRRDVELENAVRGGEAKARVLKANADKAQEHVETLRKQLDEQETSQSRLQREFDDFRNSNSASSEEAGGLRAQVSRLEASKRDTLSLLDAKTTAYDNLARDLSQSQQKAIDLRRQVTDLEEKQQQTNNAVNSAKFKESALQQEVDLLKRNNEWLDNELKSKTNEFSKFRKDRSARVSELQRANEEANTTIASLRRTEGQLRGRIGELERKSEEHLLRIQRLQEEKVRADEGFRAELDGARRLAQLQEQSALTARRRVEELDEELEGTRQGASEEISAIQSELETERQAKEAAEQKVEDLEAQVEGLQTVAAQPQTDERQPMTPRRGLETPKPFGSSVRPASPALGTPNSRMRSSTSMTQLVSDLNKTKAELEEERRRNTRLNATFEEMMADLEAKAPELQDLNEDKARLEADISSISSSLNHTQQDRDAYKKDSRKFESQVHGLVREADLLRQQLRDLSLQVKVLTVEVQIRSDGLELSNAERQALQRAASGESDERVLEGMTDTGRFISQHLATFRNIFELQDQNAKLLHLTRQLGEQMEGEEAKAKKNLQDQKDEELNAMRSKVDEYRHQLGELKKQTTSFMKERDTYRRMCAHRGQIPGDADLDTMFGETINGISTPSKNQQNGEVNGNAASHDLAQESRLLKEMQLHFDAYKREAATDHQTLRGQVDGLARDKGSLQGDLARAKSQISMAQERYEMLQANYNMLRSECEELQKRSQSYAETAAKQDARTQQALEDLVQQRELENGLRGENANLKAERDLSKRMQDRLDEENKSLYTERDRLNNLIANTQKLSSEREASYEDQRRRLQGQVDALEAENRVVKQKLDEELDSSKNASLRREYDTEQNQIRIDDLMKSLSATKEELTAAKTVRDQLQARVEELKIELRNAQEHAQALQPRPTARPGTAATSSDEASLNREQELSIEVADLRRELELIKTEHESAKEQVEQYKGISASSEEALSNLESTFEEYRDDADKTAEEKDASIKDLEQRRDEILNELSVTNTQLTELRTTSDNHQVELDRQKADYEAQLARLTDESDRYKATAELRLEDVKEQAAIAQRAQQNYEAELIKHGDAAKKLQDVRTELNEVKLQVASARSDAETARAQLTQSEESWTSSREALETEVSELKRRKDDADRQNNLLHQQLENVNTQISELQQQRQSSHRAEDDDETAEPDSQKYSEIIKYLRREKEIVDVQYELSLQEARRFKQQLEHSESELNDARLRLEQERQRQQSQQSYNKLAETINQLNVFRESNETLRSESRQAQAQLVEKVKQIDELTAQIEPLRASVTEYENNHEIAQGELKLLQEDRDRWQKRTQDIMSKYDRVDPAEMQELRDKLAALEQEKIQALTDKDALQTRIDGFESELEQVKEQAREQSKKETIQKARDQFLSKFKDTNEKLKSALSEKQSIQERLDQTQTELDHVREDLTQVRNAPAATQDETATATELPQSSTPSDVPTQTAATQTSTPPSSVHTQENAAVATQEAEEGEVDEDSPAKLEEALHQAQQESERASGLEKTVNDLEDQVQTLESQIEELKQQLESQRMEMENLRTSASETAPASETTPNEHMQKLQDDLAAAQTELEALRQDAPAETTVPGTDSSHLSELQTRLESEYKQKAEELEASFQKRISNMREQLNTKLREGREKNKEEARQAIKAEHEAELAKLNQAHDAVIADLKAQHASALQARPEPDGDQGKAATPLANGEADPSRFPSEPADVKSFVANNPTVRGMISRTVDTRIKPEREAMQQKIQELEAKHQSDIAELDAAHAAKIKELEDNTEKARMAATNLAEKKSAVKLNMAIKHRDEAKAKIELVQKAAAETPAKAVSEVWDIAKNTKATAVPSARQPQTLATPAPSVGSLVTQSQTTQPVLNTEDAPATAHDASTADADVTLPSQAVTQPQQQSSVPATPAPVSTQAPLQQQQQQQTGGSAIPRPGSAMGIRGQPRRLSNASQTHAQQQQSTQSRPASSDSKDATSRKLPDVPLTSGIARGTGIPRGGSIRGRGGAVAGRGAMNPGAGNFVPGQTAGQKRGFEGEQGRGGGEKKVRGGRGG
ncbi:MAG: hypothetical protein Q9162_002042 [Coniocarpon cinnabarinum]